MSLFNRPISKKLGDVDVEITLLTWSQFDDAIAVGTWIQQFPDLMPSLTEMSQVRIGGDLRAAIDRILCGCISMTPSDDANTQQAAPQPLTHANVADLPIPTLLEAMLLIMEVNVDFFLQSLPTYTAIKRRMQSTGSPLLSSSSVPATVDATSAPTPSPS